MKICHSNYRGSAGIAPEADAGRVRSPKRRRAAFTMIEIAIAIGVIGFALVAIIGILPAGLNVQKETHQDTTISQDGPFFLEAIRNGGPINFIWLNNVVNDTLVPSSQNLDFLTNYIDEISLIQTTTLTGPTNGSVTNYTLTTAPMLTSGQQILGLLGTPEFLPDGQGGVATNGVVALVRGLSGNATEQSGANKAVAFRYFMTVEIDRVNSATNLINPFPAPYVLNNLYDIRLKFAWPVIVTPSGTTVGPGRQTYRSIISGQLLPFANTNFPWWFFQPNSYTTNYTLL